MTEPSSNNIDRRPERHGVLSWLLLPISLFPLAALLSYDWRAVGYLSIPPAPSANWIGALGDGFAYWGYALVGLAVWVIPFHCFVIGICHAVGRRHRFGLRSLWLVVFLAAAACLVQTLDGSPVVIKTLREINVQAAGGVIGYLMMRRFLIPAIGDVGALVTVTSLAVFAFVAAIGLRTIAQTVRTAFNWATVGLGPRRPVPPISGDREDEARYVREQGEYAAAMEAKENARREREAAREAAREERRQARAAALAAREARRAEREAAANRLTEPDLLPTPPAEERPSPKTRSVVRPTPSSATPVSAPAPAPAQANGGSPTGEEPKSHEPYVLPPVTLLAPLRPSAADHGDVNEMAQRIIDTLKIFNVDATLCGTVRGPVVTKYKIQLAVGTRYQAVMSLATDLKGALRAKSLRIEAPIPGDSAVGIEVPNRIPAGISFREIFESEAWRNSKAELPLLFGKRADGRELVADLASMPHMLVAGATGQGKSVCLNSLICGLLMTRTPEQLKLIMVDPKCVEFTPYASIPHLLVPVITDNRKVVFSLHWAVAEMEKRLKLFSRAKVRNIYDFNHRKSVTQTDMFGRDETIGSDIPRTVPYIVIIIDEAADLIGQCGKEVNPDIQRITQKARAAGIHLILATQRPDAKIITGTIKANIPGRVAFKTSQAIDSRTILDEAGAENLIGRGDMLFRGKDNLLVRAQGAWISDNEIADVTQFIAEHSDVQFDNTFATKLGRVKEAAIEDPFADNADDPDNQESAVSPAEVKAAANASDFKKAVECVINTHRASTSHFQRQMGWGYNHAAKILDMLTDRGVVSAPMGMGPRQIVMSQDQLAAILCEGDESDMSDNSAAPQSDAASPNAEAEEVPSEGSENTPTGDEIP